MIWYSHISTPPRSKCPTLWRMRIGRGKSLSHIGVLFETICPGVDTILLPACSSFRKNQLIGARYYKWEMAGLATHLTSKNGVMYECMLTALVS